MPNARQFKPQVLVSQAAAGSSFATYTTAKTVLPAESLVTLPKWFYVPGRRLEIQVGMSISNIVTTPGLMNFAMKMGTAAAPISVFSSGNIQLNATAHTLLPAWLDIALTCRANADGAAGATLLGMGRICGVMFTLTAAQTDAANCPGEFPLPATAPAVGTGFDNSIENILDFWVGFTISDAANLVRVESYRVLQMG